MTHLKNNHRKNNHRNFIFALCLIPLIGILAPRSLAFLPALIGTLSILSHYFAHKTWPRFNIPALYWMSGLLALIALGSLWAISAEMVGDRLVKITPIFYGGIILAAVAGSLTPAGLENFKKVYPSAMIVVGSFCVIELYSGGFLYPLLHEAAQTSKDLSYLNRSVIIVLLCAMPVFFMESSKYLKGALFLLITLALLKTDSQSAQLAGIIAIIFATIWPIRLKISWVFLGIIMTLFILTAPFLVQFLFHNVADTLQKYYWFQTSYAADRLEIWDFIARRALEKPFLGYGIEATRLITDFDMNSIYRESSTVLHPHNFVLQIWIEFGLLGVAFISVFLNYLLWQMQCLSRKSPVSSRFCLTIFIMCLTMAATSYGLWQGWWLGTFSLMFALCILMIQMEGRLSAKK